MKQLHGTTSMLAGLCATLLLTAQLSPTPGQGTKVSMQQDIQLSGAAAQYGRGMIADGRSDGEILNFMVTRYGDFVLYRPPVKGTTLLLWGGPIALLVLGLVVLVRYQRRRAERVAAQDRPLTADETRRAEVLLGEGDRR